MPAAGVLRRFHSRCPVPATKRRRAATSRRSAQAKGAPPGLEHFPRRHRSLGLHGAIRLRKRRGATGPRKLNAREPHRNDLLGRIRRAHQTRNMKEERMRTCLVPAIAALSVTLGSALLAPTNASAVGLGQTCGGIIGVPCDTGLFCQHPAGQCKVFDAQGTCAKVPTRCFRIFRPVCGCDGKTYANDCTRQAAKVQLDHTGRCKKY